MDLMPQSKDIEWLNRCKKTRPIYMQCTRSKRHTETESKQMGKLLHMIGKKEKAGAVILMSDKTEFKVFNKR